MNPWTNPDPAADPRGGVGVSTPDIHVPPTAAIIRIARRWWIIAIALAVTVGAGLAYVIAAPKTYTATCVLAADRGPASPGGNVAPDEFLFQQRDQIRSPAVLSAGGDAGAMAERLDVDVSKGEGLMTLRLTGANADEAARQLNAVTDAYLRTRTTQQSSTSVQLTDLTKQRDQLAAARAEKEKAIRQYRATAMVPGSDAAKTAMARLDQLTAALTAAQAEAAAADAATESSKAQLADPAKIAQLIAATPDKQIFAGLDQKKKQIQAELAQTEALLLRQKQTMSPQHPSVIASERKLQQLKARIGQMDQQYAETYRASLDQQRAAAAKKVEELKLLVEQQTKANNEVNAGSSKLKQLEDEINQSDAALAEVDRRIRDMTLTGDSAAPVLKVVQRASPPRRPSHPNTKRTLLIAAGIGIVLGLALAARPRQQGAVPAVER
jgi:succinoglycan biosynthesis transport protein ExoP